MRLLWHPTPWGWPEAKKMNLIKQIFGAIIILVLCNPFLYAADSRNYPVTATYCDGSTIDIYPFSFVTRTDGSTFNCYKVLVNPIQNGYRYGFEDKDDDDYNDIIIELWVTGNNTSSPVAHVKYISKEAAYKHWLHVVYSGSQQLVFKAEEAVPGTVFDIPLPIKECGDFEINATPPQRAIDQGDSTYYNITIKALNGFTNSVNLSLDGFPAGASGVFQPNPLPITGEAKLDITTTPQVPVGTYTLTITGTAGELSHTAEVTLEIKEKPPEPDFTIEAVPDTQTLYQGESTNYKIKLTSINGFSKGVGLSIEDELPTGVTAAFQPGMVQPGGESELTITTSESTPVDSYTLSILGKSVGKRRRIKITLIVRERPPEPDFEIKAEPADRTVYRGESANYTVTLTALNEFSEEVSLSVTGVPAGTAATFGEAAVTPTGTTQFQITTSADTPVGSHTLTITAKGGGKEHSAAVKLDVACRDFSLEIKASTDRGSAPLAVKFEADISRPGAETIPISEYGFRWDFGDGTTSDQQNPEHTFQAPGNYQVTVSATDACGQVKTASAVVEVEGFEGTITKSFSLSEAIPGDEVFITIEVRNDTRLDFTNIFIRDELSPLLEYLEDSAGVTPRRAGQELEWQFPLLKKGDTISFKIKVKTAENAPPGVIDNTAFLYHDSLGPGKRITSNTASLTINRIDVTLHKQVEQTTAKPGDTIKYQLTIKNNSNVPLTGVKLTDELSQHLEFVSAARNGSLNFTRQGRRLQWEGKVEPQEQVVIIIQARVSSNLFSGTRIENTAKLEAVELKEPIISDTVVTTVTAEPVSTSKVRFTKRSEVPQTEIGRIIRFSIMAANMSNSTLISPVIEDHLPQGFSYVARTTLLNNRRFTEPQGKRRLVWQLPHIRPNETVVIRYQVVIGADARRGKNVNRAVLRATDNSGQDLFLEASAFVNVSTSSIIFYSGVEGTVYLDRDGDDFYSMMDKPLDGIEVRMSTGEKAITDALGQYRFENLFPGEYAVGINSATLPEKYKVFSQSPQVVVLMDGLTDTVDFAVKYDDNEDPTDAWLEGRVFFDKNQNQRYDEGDALVNSFQANIDNKLQTAGQNGKFLLYKLKTGTHTIVIKLNNRSSPKIVELKQGKNVMDFPLKYSLINIVIKGEDK